MKNILKLFGIITLIAIIGFVFISCSNPVPDMPDIPVAPPTPSISGTVQKFGFAEVGHDLWADTSALTGSGVTSYEWRRNGTNIIDDANSNEYILQDADIGSTITVTVTRDGYLGSVTSNPVGPVAAALITWTITPSGSPTTTELNFNFSADPGALTASDITINSDSGSATRGTLSGTGTTRTLTVSNVTAGTVWVSINLTGVASWPAVWPQTVTLVTPGPDITWTVAAVGTPTTTSLSFTFNANPGILAESDITITSETGSATRGTLSGTGTTRTLTVSDVTAGTVSISIARTGIESSPASWPQTVTLVANNWTVTAAGSPTTTTLSFTFNANPGTLTASDITITSEIGSAIRGTLSGTGTTRTLTVSDVIAGTVSVSITSGNADRAARTVVLVTPAPLITWSATPFGTPTTTEINFTFSADPGALTASNITISGTGSATRGTLSGTGTTRTLNISDVRAGTVSISIARTGVTGESQAIPLVANSWTVNAVGTPTTTTLNFTFDADPGALTASNITITSGTGSATRGTISGTGTTRALTISNVVVGTVSVSITSGNADRAPRTATLVAPITWTATAVGSPVTTSITFTFNAAPTGLVATDFTITSGTGSATRGTLSGSGTTRTLTVSNVSTGNVSISINRTGIVSSSQQVPVVGPITWTATAVGTPVTTSITFTFSAAPPTGLVASDFTITSGTGSATRGTLSGTGTTRTLTVSDVTTGNISISINRAGIVSTSQQVPVSGPITWTAIADGSPTSTSIIFTFSAAPPSGLIASDFTITCIRQNKHFFRWIKY